MVQLVGSLRRELAESLSTCKVLVVGAGGIGCELLKNLVLTGFKNIEVIDLDTIDVSNLNRQFLFQKKHVGKSKAQVAKESALQFCPSANITAYHDSIMNPDYNVEFFRKFMLVMNALDNRAARNHVNRMCLAADIPLIESGTAGYLGQVTVIKKGMTECYECQPKPTQKTFPGCTIRNTPSEPIHCIVWAKYLFNEESWTFGSVDYWLRLRIPMTETIQLFKEKLKAVGYISQPAQLQPSSSSNNELFITVQRCSDLQSRSSQLPSPYVVYKFFDFPDYPTSTVHDRCDPTFNDLKSYAVLMDVDLDQYLQSDVLQFYVFDYKEEQMDTYLGKARVPLLGLAHDQKVTGVFQLVDPTGLPAGHIEVTLKWKSTYLRPPGSIMAPEEPRFIPEEKPVEETSGLNQEKETVEEQKKDSQLKDAKEKLQEENKDLHQSTSQPQAAATKAPLPKLRTKTLVKETPAARRVTFVETTSSDEQLEERSSAASSKSAEKRETSLPAIKVLSKAPQSTTEKEDDDEEEESHVSEGQLVPVSTQSYSDDSEISEEIAEDVEEAPAAAEDQSESTQSDSDDCIVHGQATGRKPSERLRVEIVSLSLKPDSRVSQDVSVVRLFVEYSILDQPTEETPLSLPKPPPGRSINYNYSKVIPVDAETNEARRRLLRGVLQGRNPQMERIRFTVVSDPPEEEQEKECEDVGVAFLRIPEILEKQRDLMEASLDVLDVEDSRQLIGCLTVSVEGLEALRSIMEDDGSD